LIFILLLETGKLHYLVYCVYYYLTDASFRHIAHGEVYSIQY